MVKVSSTKKDKEPDVGNDVQRCARLISAEIMENISGRLGFNLFSCDHATVKEIRQSLTAIAARYIETMLSKKDVPVADQYDPHTEPVPYCGVVIRSGEPFRWATIEDLAVVGRRTVEASAEPNHLGNASAISLDPTDRLAMHGKIALELRTRGGA